MGVRHVPELAFLADRQDRFEARINELMSRSRKYASRSAKSGPQTSQEQPSGGSANAPAE
jgi:hypothetical protein